MLIKFVLDKIPLFLYLFSFSSVQFIFGQAKAFRKMNAMRVFT
jgi:hypothetical protein